jgi:integrase
MAARTEIAWTDASFNTHWGCLEVSPGCDHCYARTLAERFGRRIWGPPAGLEPAEVLAIIDAASCERDRLFLRALWATGGRVSEVLAPRPIDVQRARQRAVTSAAPRRRAPSGS